MNRHCEALQKPKQTTLCRHTERSEVSKSLESNKKAKSMIIFCRHTERDKREVSKSLESSTPKESMIKNRINKLDSPLQHYDSYNLDSYGLDSSLRTLCFAQNDEFKI